MARPPLALWQRFHVRLGVSYGLLVLVILGALAGMMLGIADEAAFRGLQAELRGMAVSLGTTLPPEVAAIEGDGPAYRALRARLDGVLAGAPEIDSVYVLVPTGVPGELRFAGDAVRHGQPGRPGERYDSRQAPRMIEGLAGPVVEDIAYADAWGTFLSGYAPVRDAEGRAVALVGLDIRLERIEAMRRNLLRASLVAFGIAGVALVLVTVAVGRYLRGPLERLIAATSAVDAGDLGARTGLRRSDEFGLLGQHFDHMAEGLEEREHLRDTFGRYLSPAVARAALARAALGGDLRVVTVLFIDLRGYSTLSEALAPERVVSLMNGWFEAMTAAVEAEGGTVIELLGDGMLVVFGAPVELPDHAACAVRAALAMQLRSAELAARWEAEGLAEVWRRLGVARIGARIGLHTGPVVAGNLGSPRRMKYGVIGDTVNVAARVEGLNKELGTAILMTDATRDALPEALRARTVDRGAHAVKGRAQAVRVAEIVPENLA